MATFNKDNGIILDENDLNGDWLKKANYIDDNQTWLSVAFEEHSKDQMLLDDELSDAFDAWIANTPQDTLISIIEKAKVEEEYALELESIKNYFAEHGHID